MARRSSGGGRSARPAARTPPPQTAPARAQGRFGSFFLHSIADGVGFGAGNAVANRAVDAVMGPHTIRHQVDAAAPAPAPSVACTLQSRCSRIA